MSSALWYRAAVSEEHPARHVAAVRDQFVEALEAAGSPAGVCLFATRRATSAARPRGADDDAADMEALFFSPAAISAVPHLIAVCGAAPSPPPDRNRAVLLVGRNADWNLLPHQTH